MAEEKYIVDLFEKLISNRATSQDKKELFKLISNEQNKKEIFTWLENIWDQAAFSQAELSSEALLGEIHKKIDGPLPPTDNQSIISPKLRRIIINALKYAAIVLIGCGIEWFYLTQYKNNRSLDPEKTSNQIRFNEISVPKGSNSFLVLEDGTKVWLNGGASFKYPSSFQMNSREVYLEGEAFFDVAKNAEAPFYVGMDVGMNIKVLGTRFNVKAYSEDNSIETTLIEGSIEIVGVTSGNRGEVNLKLKPGQKLILFKEHSGHQIMDTEDVDVYQKSQDPGSLPGKIERAELITLQNTNPETSWTEGKLIFQKERFEDVKIKLERWYGVTIEVEDKEILDYRFTGVFENETFAQAILALKQAAGFDYTIDKKHVIINRN